MTSKKYIDKKLKMLALKFNEAEIRYEFRVNTKTHIVEILPLNFFENNKDYLVEELIFENEFETLYPDENIIFISENSLIKINKIDLELKDYKLKNIDLKTIFKHEFDTSECWIDYDAEGLRTIIRAMKNACNETVQLILNNGSFEKDEEDIISKIKNNINEN